MKAKTAVKTATVADASNIKKLKNLIEEGGKIELSIAFLAQEIYQTEEYKNLGYKTFGDFAKAELNISYRKILWLLQIGQTCIANKITQKQLQDTGVDWTKLKEVFQLVETDTPPEKIKGLLAKAKSMTYEQVEEFVKSERVKRIGGEIVKYEILKFKLFGDQVNTVNLALETVKGLINTDNAGQALEYICAEWVQNYAEKPIEMPVTEPEKEEVKVPRKKRADVIRKASTPAKNQK